MNQRTYWTGWRKGILLSASFLLTLLVGVSCKKATNTLGTGALDPEALLSSGGIDTFHLDTYTEAYDTFPTDNQTFAIVGSLQDPEFGKFAASFYTQLHPTSTIQFPSIDNLKIDSVVLSLRYGGYYGHLEEQTFRVEQVTEDLSLDDTYYRNSTKQTTGVNLVMESSAAQTPNTIDSVTVGGVNQASQLRLLLDTVIGREIITDAFNGEFTDDPSFTTYFKGLKVSVEPTAQAPGDGGILYFSLTSSITRLTIYYTLNGVSNPISFEVDGNCADFNHVDIDNTGYPVEQVMADHLNGQTAFYSQAFRSRAVVKFPTLENLPKNCIVHDALLVLPVSYQSFNLFYPSASAAVGFYSTSSGELTFKAKSIDYDNGTKRYVVDMRDYVQDIVLGNESNNGLYLYPVYFGSTAERIVFNGPNTTNKYKPKLIIKYTEY